MTAVRLLLVGSELLEGRVADRNGGPLARAVTGRGGTVEGIRLLPDERGRIASEVGTGLAEVDGVVIAGGIGPTDDDPTREAVADALATELRVHPGWERRLEERGLPDRRTEDGVPRQARLPAGARLLENPHGTAPAFADRTEEGWYVALPGVPEELVELLDGTAGRFLDEVLPGEVRARRRVGIAGVAESSVARRIDGIEELDGLRVASYPRRGVVDLHLSGPGDEEGDAVGEERLDAAVAALRRAFGADVYEVGERGLAEVVEDSLREAGSTLAVAESCTGGLLGGALTAVPGSSDVFWGGVVAYADRAKTELLGVGAPVLASSGAVSEPTARAMAEGIRRRGDCDWSAAVTGVAGPGGGSPGRPVGTVWIAVDGPAPAVRRHRFPGDREEVRERSVHGALDLLRRRITSGQSG